MRLPDSQVEQGNFRETTLKSIVRLLCHTGVFDNLEKKQNQ